MMQTYLENLENHHTPPGDHYPWRKQGWVHKVRFDVDQDEGILSGSHYVIVSVNCHEEPVSVAVFGPKIGSGSYEIVRDASIWISKMLEDDISVQDIISMSGRHADGRPRSVLGAVSDVLAEYLS